MKKLLASVLFFLVLFALPVANLAQDQISPATQNTNMQGDVVLECLKYVNPAMGKGEPGPVEGGKITGTCSSPTGCYILTGKNGKKTSGNLATDQLLFGSGVTSIPGGVPIIKLVSGAQTVPNGQVNESVKLIGARGHVSYDVYAAHKSEPVGKGADNQDPSQQVGTTTLTFPDGGQRCRSIYWDPYGRVFDGVSLEPLNAGDATVTLLDEKGTKSNATLINDVQIDELGKYNILVNADGKYRLNVTPKAGYLFKSFAPDPKYKDLYDFIYMPGDAAFEEVVANPKRVDVPLMPVGAPLTREPGYVYREYVDVLIDGATFTKISLRTIHPMTKVTIMVNDSPLTDDGTGTPIPEFSDKDGNWLAVVKKESTSQNGFSIVLSKDPKYYPLATQTISKIYDWLMGFLVKKVSAQQTIKIETPVNTSKKIIEFAPILDYIEGYAYGQDGNPIANAKVRVVLDMDKSVYYSTVADEAGFFTILPKNLPPLEFYLEFIDPITQKSQIQTTTEFVKTNNAYIDSQKMDLVAATKYGQKIVDSNTGELNKIVKDENFFKNQQTSLLPTSIPQQKQSLNLNLVLMMVVVLLLIIGVIFTIFFMMKKRQTGITDGLTN